MPIVPERQRVTRQRSGNGTWAKGTVAGPGEFGGKKHDEARHYATLATEFPK